MIDICGASRAVDALRITLKEELAATSPSRIVRGILLFAVLLVELCSTLSCRLHAGR